MCIIRTIDVNWVYYIFDVLWSGDSNAVKTEVAEATQNPIWNTTLELKNVQGEQLMEKSLEVTLWDFKPDKEQVFLG